MYRKYGDLLQMLHSMIKSETAPRVRDNICATTSRILSVGHAHLPVAEVNREMHVYVIHLFCRYRSSFFILTLSVSDCQ